MASAYNNKYDTSLRSHYYEDDVYGIAWDRREKIKMAYNIINDEIKNLQSYLISTKKDEPDLKEMEGYLVKIKGDLNSILNTM